MGLFDKAKDLAGQHADKVGEAIDKVADVVDEKTGGKYTEHVGKGAEAAKGFVDGDGEQVVVRDEGDTPTPSR